MLAFECHSENFVLVGWKWILFEKLFYFVGGEWGSI